MRAGRCVVALVLVCLPGVVLAESSGGDGVAWLQKIASAAHRLNYSGTFVYQRGTHMETTSIVHMTDESGEHEKLEVLDGPPREFIRNNDEVICFTPESKGVLVEKRRSQKSFPALLPRQLSGISENYAVKLGGVERVAGLDCQNVILEPRDVYRYGHRFCAESSSGLLLKASTLNEKNEVLNQFAFTHARIGGNIDREQLKPKYARHHHIPPQATPAMVDSGWQVKSPPAGFKKIMEQKRTFPGKKVSANHLVFSDELVAVSVFIEPLAGMEKSVSGLSSQGSIKVYAKPIADYQVTVLGEVPAATLMQIANSVAFSAK
ncbi:MAG: MucB/RseB C-terminal domain-containing protein [Sulfurimicrobium sp.]|nr:MucB/RseB C-terminal domain-containing protein [Sulfurimicrobium sp.]MDP2198013.1 MucB/RseB C-terminal domain-containing protein [Sulfurimicrobium sp.]